MTQIGEKVAIVTGAAGGLGAATAAALSARGWTVAGLDRARPGTTPAYEADITDRDAVDAAVADVLERYGRIDGVAHCAGIFRNALAPLHRFDDDAWHET